MELRITTKKLLNNLNVLHNINSIRQPLLNSLKQGLFVFVLILLLLELLKNAQSIIHGKPLNVVDAMDAAIASLGFLLTFVRKLLERMYGKV